MCQTCPLPVFALRGYDGQAVVSAGRILRYNLLRSKLLCKSLRTSGQCIEPCGHKIYLRAPFFVRLIHVLVIKYSIGYIQLAAREYVNC